MKRGILSVLFILFLATCSTPVVEQPAATASDEKGAIAALQAINQAQQDFIRRTRRYALTYDELVMAVLLKEKPSAANLGYDIVMRPSADAVSYSIIATPTTNPAQARHFFTDKTGVIRAEQGRAATAESPQI